jgi:hypothetical protein
MTIEEINAEIEKVSRMPHHYDMYGHQPGCGVCWKLKELRSELMWVKGCPGGHPWNTHKGYVGGFSGKCPE